MANHKSAKKRAKQTIVRTERNKARKTTSKSTLKAIRTAIENKEKEAATALLTKTQAVLGKLAKLGVIKPNKAARITSRLATQVAKL